MRPISKTIPRLVVPRKTRPTKPTVFAPPLGQCIVITTMAMSQGRPITVWYAGPLGSLNFHQDATPVYSWTRASSMYVAEPAEVILEGFHPNMSGTEPLKSKKWPTPPPPLPPPKPRSISDYSNAELMSALDAAIAHRVTAEIDGETDEEIDKEATEYGNMSRKIDDLKAEVQHRFRKRPARQGRVKAPSSTPRVRKTTKKAKTTHRRKRS